MGRACAGQSGGRVYFAGDTGYPPNSVKFAGAWGRPSWRCCRSGLTSRAGSWDRRHMNPDDAVRAHLDLGADLSVAMHFGTFPLADEAIDAPGPGAGRRPAPAWGGARTVPRARLRRSLDLAKRRPAPVRVLIRIFQQRGRTPITRDGRRRTIGSYRCRPGAAKRHLRSSAFPWPPPRPHRHHCETEPAAVPVDWTRRLDSFPPSAIHKVIQYPGTRCESVAVPPL